MARITLTLCDVGPCNNTADRDFQINGGTIHVCGEGCYARYWSREYRLWKKDPYELHTKSIPLHKTNNSGRVLKVVSSNE